MIADKQTDQSEVPAQHISQVDEIRHAIDLLCETGALVELRILKLKSGSSTAYGYYNDMDKLAHDAAMYDRQAAGIYVTPNRLNPQLAARQGLNKIVVVRGDVSATSNNEITRRLRILIDVDPKRPKDTSSSDEQHETALAKTRIIEKCLRDNSFPEPIVSDSGNGGHLVFALDLPNTPEINDLIKRFLEALDYVFSDETVTVDTTVHNPARIWKLYGTTSAKGTDSGMYPWRKSRILSAPEKLEVVTEEQIRHIAAMLPEAPKATYNHMGGSVDVEAFIGEHGLGKFRRKHWNGLDLYELETCPFDSGHKRSARITKSSDGAVGFQCFHNSCSGYKWQELKEHLGIGKASPSSTNPTSDAAAMALERADAANREAAPSYDQRDKKREAEVKDDAKNPEPWRELMIKDAFAQRDPIPWIVKDWIPAGGNSIWYGPPGIGKTLVLQYIAVNVALGRPIFPPRTRTGPAGKAPIDDVEEIEVTQTGVIFLEMDQGERITSDRFKFIAAGAGVKEDTNLPLWYYVPEDFDIMDPLDRALLVAKITEHRAGLVIIDNLAYISGTMDENKASDMKLITKELQRIAKTTGAALVTIHHDKKDQPGSSNNSREKLRGSTALAGGVKLAVHVTRPDEKQDIIELWQSKNRLDKKRGTFAEWSYSRHPDNDHTVAGRFYGVSGESADEARDSTVKAAIIDVVRKQCPNSQQALLRLVQGTLSPVKAGEKVIVRLANELHDEGKINIKTGFKGAREYLPVTEESEA